MYNFRECHADKTLTDIFIEPVAIWTDAVIIDGLSAYCFVFVDSANNKYTLYTGDKALFDKFVGVIKNDRVIVHQDLIVINESHFIKECSDIKDEKKQLAVASDVKHYVMNYNFYDKGY